MFFLQNCINYICSSIVIEITVSLAWCVNVLISFYSEKKRKKNNVTWVLLVHNILWTLHSVAHFCSCCRLWIELEADFINGQWKQTFFLHMEDFFQDVQLCYPKHTGMSLADCGMKVSVRIKKVDILSVINVFWSFLFTTVSTTTHTYYNTTYYNTASNDYISYKLIWFFFLNPTLVNINILD